MKLLPVILFLCFLCGCGYHHDGGEKIAVSVPYVVGDFEGELTDAIVAALSETADFRYTTGNADWVLKVKVESTKNERIGYRYDRKTLSKSKKNALEERGKLTNTMDHDDCDKFEGTKNSVIGIENRRGITVKVSVINAETGKLILGPQIIQADSDFDYFNPKSLQDLSYVDPVTGVRTSSVAFSLGQLDNVGSAGEDALYPTYKRLAQKIVDGMIASGNDGV